MPLYPSSYYDTSRPTPSWWHASASEPAPPCPALEGDDTCDVAVIGAGYTGLSAALHLARDHGLSVRVLEAGYPGWGASGRSGGFCCIGGAKLSYQAMIRRFGLEETRAFFGVQRAAVDLVRAIAQDEGIDLGAGDAEGEVCLAHRPNRAKELQEEGAFLARSFGVEARWLSPEALAAEGLRSSLHGGLFLPQGFGLHPLNYARGLARAALAHGAVIHGHSKVIGWAHEGRLHRLATDRGNLRAAQVLLATNGYEQGMLLPAQERRRLPVLSSILVTRPLSAQERQEQGWQTTILAYDSRDLLHYFRLLPDGRFLFGGRGGVSGRPGETAQQRRGMEARFRSFFPAWRAVPFTHFWNGLACLAADRVPHIGPIDGLPGAYQAFAYHGNGVALATWAGRTVAQQIAGRGPQLPAPLRQSAPTFPLPALRKLFLRGAYVGLRLRDELL